jgi:putative transposase
MVNRSGSTKRRLNETQHRQSKAHKMEMQISRGIYPEVSQEKHLRMGEKELGPIIRDLAQQKESVVEEGHLMADHVHMLLSIPPKYSVSGVVGFIKGKSAIAIARNFMDRAKNFVGQNFWARGYYVSTVGRDEAQIREYIREQEKEDKRLEQLKIFE